MNLPPIESNFRHLANHDPEPRSCTGTIPVACDYGSMDVTVIINNPKTVGYYMFFLYVLDV